MRNACILLMILLFTTVSSYAQEAILSAGGDGTGNGGSVAFSIGQVIHKSSNVETERLYPGVQHAYEISVVSDQNKFREIGLTLSTYPNPVSDFLILKVDSHRWINLGFEIYNSEGKIFMSQRLRNMEAEIDMRMLTPGVYILRVSMDKETIRIFKIIKK